MNYEEWLKEYKKYLKENPPFNNKHWDKEKLYQYLVYSCIKDTEAYVNEYFSKYTNNENLLKLLFDFLLDDSYNDSDCQIPSAYYIARMDKTLLEKYSDLLSEAGRNPIDARNPLKYME